jgi:hypothetical protein
LPGDKEFIGMGKTSLQTLDGRADMARCEAGSLRDPCYAAQLTIKSRNNKFTREMHERMDLTPPHSEWSATEVDENAISIG